MIKIITCVFLTMFSFQFIMCNQEASSALENDGQFVVKGTLPDGENDNCWLNVINIKTYMERCVYTIQEIDGSYYLPIQSKLPSFNNKVVEGFFVEDSINGMSAKDAIFKVTKIVRDTTAGFPF